MNRTHGKPEVIQFGAFEVDLRAVEVRKHGYKIRLQDQPFRVLEILLERPGELVTREELQRQIWPADTFVDFDRGLNNAVKRLREALGDSAENPRIVETVPRRGYRFIASTNGHHGNGHAAAIADVAAPESHRRTWIPLAGVVAVSAALVVVLALRYWPPTRPEEAPPAKLKTLRVVASPAENPVNYAAISPDGRQIAYTDATGIHVKVIETGEVRTIPSPAGDAAGPAASSSAARFPVSWYPDGTRLLVTTGTPRSSAAGPTIWSISLVTGNAQKLYEGAWASSVSPDGSLVAALKNESEIWLMGPRGENPRQFAAAEAGTEIGRASWSPDGRRLANLRVIEKPRSLECAIETRSISDPRPVVLFSGPKFCYSQAQSLWWLPDGRVVFPIAEPIFNSRDFNLWDVRVDEKSGRAASQPERLTNWTGFSLTGVTGSTDGKRLAFLRDWFQTTITVADVDSSHPGNLLRPHRLANEVDGDLPTTWTSDSRAVVFYSVKNGDNDLYKQSLNGESAEPVVSGPGEQLAAVLSPDGQSFIYMDVPAFQSFGLPSPVRLMKIPVAGGAPQFVLTSDNYDSHQCTRQPSTFCVVSERSPDRRHLILSTFDPAKSAPPDGKRPTLLTFETDPDRNYQWAISPDGSQVAFSKVDEHEIRIRLTSLQGARDAEMKVNGSAKLESMHWAPDQRSLFISTRSPSGCTLLQVDLHGTTHVLSQQPGAFQMWALPSPDGRRLAVFSATMNSEVWTAENF